MKQCRYTYIVHFFYGYCAVCDETQNLNDTDSETFFRYQIFSRPIPRLFSVPKFFETDSETFFGTHFFRYRFQDFFWYQNLSWPIPRLFSVLIVFETGSETFFGTKFFRDRFWYHTKKCKNPGNGTRPGPKSTQIFWKMAPIFFFGTKFFRDRFRYHQ